MLPIQSQDTNSQPSSYGVGVKSLRQLRKSQQQQATDDSVLPNKSRNPKIDKKIELTYDYFAKEVDPIVGDCITYLLCNQPEDVTEGMLQYLKSRKENKDIKSKTTTEKSAKAKRSQRIYLATQISPVLTKLINRVARSKPEKVIDFMCIELESMKATTNTSSNDASLPRKSITISSHQENPTRPFSAVPGSVKEVNNNAQISNTRPESAPINRSTGGADTSTKNDVPITTPLVEKTVRKIQIAVIGPGSSGKTSLINCMKGNPGAAVRPSLGFKPSSMMLGEDLEIKLYDLGGGVKIRGIWPTYYNDIHAVIFVADSSASESDWKDTEQLFHDAVQHPLVAKKPVLVVANKTDLQARKSGDEIRKLLRLSTLPDANVFETTCLAVANNEGSEDGIGADPRIDTAIEWLLETVQDQFDDLEARVVRDTKERELQDMREKAEKERRVLRKKIACAFPAQVDRTLFTDELPDSPEEVFSVEDGLQFLAGEVGEELDAVATEIAGLVGYQRLALQMIGALRAPISKKKTPMTWVAIRSLVWGLRTEIGLSNI